MTLDYFISCMAYFHTLCFFRKYKKKISEHSIKSTLIFITFSKLCKKLHDQSTSIQTSGQMIIVIQTSC